MGDLDTNRKQILLLGVGNILQSDDGVGVHVIEKMRDEITSDDVEVFDGGTAGLDLLSVIDSRRTVLVVDAVDGGRAPGTVYRFTADDLDGKSLRLNSLHQLGLLETLQMASLLGRGPEQVVIIGVQPEVVDWAMELSDTVARSVPGVIGQVKKEIETARVSCYKEIAVTNDRGTRHERK